MVQFTPDIFSDRFISTLEGLLIIVVMIFLQQVLFLEYNTPKQKKIRTIIVLVYLCLFRCHYCFGFQLPPLLP